MACPVQRRVIFRLSIASDDTSGVDHMHRMYANALKHICIVHILLRYHTHAREQHVYTRYIMHTTLLCRHAHLQQQLEKLDVKLLHLDKREQKGMQPWSIVTPQPAAHRLMVASRSKVSCCAKLRRPRSHVYLSLDQT